MAKGRGITRAAPRSMNEQGFLFYTTDSATVAGAARKKGAAAPTRCLTRVGRGR